jgi:hypothetical protein
VKVVPKYLNLVQYAKKRFSSTMISFVSSTVDYCRGMCMASISEGSLVLLSLLWMVSPKHLKWLIMSFDARSMFSYGTLYLCRVFA